MHAAGPLSEESTKLLIDLREAGLMEQPQGLLWAAFIRSLTEEQKAALVPLMKQVQDGDFSRLF